MFRTLIHYWRLQLAVVAGVAVATMVLSGALLVGDSVRGSLRGMVLERLGEVHRVLLSTRMVDDDLDGGPILLMPSAARNPDRGTRASDVTLLGVDERFARFFPDLGLDFSRADGQIFPSVILNATLATELQAGLGDSVLLRYEQVAEVRRDTLMGERDAGDVVGSLRLAVKAIVPDEGGGGFGVVASQQPPANAFVELPVLQRALGAEGRANATVLGAEATREAVGRGLGLDDLGIRLVLDREARRPQIRVESRDYVFRDDVDATISRVARERDLDVTRVQSYLANTMSVRDRSLPYSMVVALDRVEDPAGERLVGVESIEPDGIVLGRWAADDLGAEVGDELTMEYFVVGPREELTTETHAFTVSAIVERTGLAARESLVPDYPGIQEAEDMASWDPPFPVDLERIRQKDEDYWDAYGSTPKAFVAMETGVRLWSTRHGTTTAILVGIPPGQDPAEAVDALADDLRAELDPYANGFRWSETRADGLRAASGATDFGQLFLAFSMFLIVSAALLIGLLFGLGVEQRRRELGLRAAVGFTNAELRRMLLREGLLLSSLGAAVGLALGVGYAALLMLALRTLWVGAVGSSRLFLHIEPASLASGFAIAVLVSLFTIWRSVARLKRASPAGLLAGAVARAPTRRAGLVSRAVIALGALGGLALIATAFVTGDRESSGLSFGAAALLLVAGVAAFHAWCRSDRRRARSIVAGGGLATMAARNSRWNPGRSFLSVALIATACFVIVTVAASRHRFGAELADKGSASGGFALLAASDIPIYQDLDDPGVREELALDADAAVYSLRALPGDDASCLNLYRPERPTILGVPPELVERGGFAFRSHAPLPEGAASPWTLLATARDDGTVPAVIDVNSATWILKVGLGDTLEVDDQLGGRARLLVVGLLEKSILQSQVLIPEAAFRHHFPDRAGYGFFLIETPWEDAAATAAAFEDALGDFGFDARTSVETMRAYQRVEHTYLSTFQMLGGFGLLLGTIGLAVVLLRNLVERRAELATLRACGFRVLRLIRLVTLETAFLLATGIAIGTGASLLALTPRLATLHAPWGEVALTLAAVFAVGLIAALLAARRVAAMPLIESLRADR